MSFDEHSADYSRKIDRASAATLLGFALAGFGWGYLAGAASWLDFLQPGRHTYALYAAASGVLERSEADLRKQAAARPKDKCKGRRSSAGERAEQQRPTKGRRL